MARSDSVQRRTNRYDAEEKAGRALTFLFGLGFLAIGVWGFALTGVDGDWLDHDTGEEILGYFEVNGLHNAAHVLFGITGMLAAARLVWSLTWNVVTALAYGGLVVYGMFAADETWDVLSVNGADNWLHLGLAALAAAIAMVCYKALRDLRRAATIDLRERTQAPSAGSTRTAGPAPRTTQDAGGSRRDVR